MNFGNNLKILRKESKISQEVLAEKIGVTRQSVSKWETGEAYPEMSNIVALCKIFHCNINDLINDNIIDADEFDADTKESIIKFKEHQQKSMKKISKWIYRTSDFCKIILTIPIILNLIIILFSLINFNNIKINDDYIELNKYRINYEIKDNNVIINDGYLYFDIGTNIEKISNEKSNNFILHTIEYYFIMDTIIAIFLVLFLHYLSKLYKNIYKGDTPFTIQNEKNINIILILLVVRVILGKLEYLLYSILFHTELLLDLNIKDLIGLLIVFSVMYLFKYGRLIQADSKARMYSEN